MDSERTTNAKKMVFVAMSGGVDSSVAALLMKKSGYNVVGVFMRCWGGGGGSRASAGVNCAERDAEDARRVAEKLGIPFYVWDFEEEYKRRVVEYMIEGYRAGITPNPDVMCNREIKFGLFLERALKAGAHYVATGHYVSLRSFARTGDAAASAAAARLHSPNRAAAGGDRALGRSESFSRKSPAQFGLFQARDLSKDQSYFLWTLTQEELRHCLFPIGDYLKSQVRAIARGTGLPTAEKKDSQGICFMGKVTLADFLKRHIPEKRGDVLAADGVKIGEHAGAHFYTIGQRHIGLANSKWQMASSGNAKPVYVVEKNIEANTIIVAEGAENSALYKKEIRIAEPNFIRLLLPASCPLPVFARVRYRQTLAHASLQKSEVGKKSEYILVFEKPQKSVAPGQSAVFYTENGEMLGGGVIT